MLLDWRLESRQNRQAGMSALRSQPGLNWPDVDKLKNNYETGTSHPFHLRAVRAVVAGFHRYLGCACQGVVVDGGGDIDLDGGGFLTDSTAAVSVRHCGPAVVAVFWQRAAVGGGFSVVPLGAPPDHEWHGEAEG